MKLPGRKFLKQNFTKLTNLTSSYNLTFEEKKMSCVSILGQSQAHSRRVSSCVPDVDGL